MSNQKIALRLSKIKHLVLICGHYEGIDHRINKYADEAISIGDYILTGGELPAMIIADSVSRLIKGVLASKKSTNDESFSKKNILEAPQYTRPYNFMGHKVPKILILGNHEKIRKWKSRSEKLKK